ncbi:hypothetical protein [Flaviaesturariibacter amylovorans]|uniref:Uncharacterized protein n=1 Tax=Flaviaesturariibacter amylovorans TaxID=1084520 RepID=A0ABP8HM25_9BACT
MTLQEAELQRTQVEQKLKELGFDLAQVIVLIAPSSESEFMSFLKRWRDSTYTYALANFGHCDMALYIEELRRPETDFVRLGDFAAAKGIIEAFQ